MGLDISQHPYKVDNKGSEGVGGRREVQEGEGVCKPTADSC